MLEHSVPRQVRVRRREGPYTCTLCVSVFYAWLPSHDSPSLFVSRIFNASLVSSASNSLPSAELCDAHTHTHTHTHTHRWSESRHIRAQGIEAQAHVLRACCEGVLALASQRHASTSATYKQPRRTPSQRMRMLSCTGNVPQCAQFVRLELEVVCVCVCVCASQRARARVCLCVCLCVCEALTTVCAARLPRA